ncbi:glycerol acyltransferase, partial [Streptomyces sp. TRM76130]|nr:glycerol acyltransferase [Streptomyces sp. TRM76130]
MADAKVIPFDDDRSRGGAGQRSSRRRTGAGSGRGGTAEPAAPVREVQALPVRRGGADDGPGAGEGRESLRDEAGGGAGLERRIAG